MLFIKERTYRVADDVNIAGFLKAPKKRAERVIKDGLSKTGLHSLFQAHYAGLGSILMFHNVVDKKLAPQDSTLSRLQANQGLEITPQFLDVLLTHLKKNKYDIISLDDLQDRLTNSNPTVQAQKFVVLTFDDGYLGNYTLAYEVLKQHHAPFTIYVATDFIDTPVVLWWYALEALLLARTAIKAGLPDHVSTLPASTALEKENSFLVLREHILSCAPDEIDIFLADLFERNAFSPQQAEEYKQLPTAMLSWEQIVTMNQDPLVTIGAHTRSHPALNQLTETSLHEELAGSKQLLETHLQKPVQHFAYPYGGKNVIGAREINMASQCGFKTAVTTVSGTIFPEHGHLLYELPRLFVSGQPESLDHLTVSLSGAHSAIANRFRRIVPIA